MAADYPSAPTASASRTNVAMAALATTHPLSYELGCQRSPMTLGRDEAGKAGQEGVTRAQMETLAAAFGQVVVDSFLQAPAPAHDLLPGHGKATPERFGVSSLA